MEILSIQISHHKTRKNAVQQDRHTLRPIIIRLDSKAGQWPPQDSAYSFRSQQGNRQTVGTQRGGLWNEYSISSLNGLGTLIFPENIFWPKPVHQFSRSPGLQEKPGQIRQQKKKEKKISFFKDFACCSEWLSRQGWEAPRGLRRTVNEEECFERESGVYRSLRASHRIWEGRAVLWIVSLS